ncbi:TPA: hypothetical protein HA253_02295 [Candidatus Woesearchaeota archaeon]|nr:hypothetical protein [Candidatus Woesearchaeota archaeon]
MLIIVAWSEKKECELLTVKYVNLENAVEEKIVEIGILSQVSIMKHDLEQVIENEPNGG